MTEMTRKPRDPLLFAAKVLTVLMQAAMVIGAAALAVATPALAIFRDRVIVEMTEETAPAVAFPLLQLMGIMLIGLGIVVLLFLFFGKLRKIIDTVGSGDPFQPLNASRLAHMGWLMLGVQVLLFPATGLGMQLARYADDMEGTHIALDSGFDITTILLIVILFVLSRVFRHGAALRAEIEGTV